MININSVLSFPPPFNHDDVESEEWTVGFDAKRCNSSINCNHRYFKTIQCQPIVSAMLKIDLSEQQNEELDLHAVVLLGRPALGLFSPDQQRTMTETLQPTLWEISRTESPLLAYQ
jgi:hypothetical protein